MVLVRQSTPRQSLVFAVLAGAFFASGFSALLYQVVWQRMLGLFSGSDVRSATIVIGAYLAGLGVGSLLGSFFADRLASRQAVQVFALCNLLIALFAFLSRFLFYDLLFKRLSVLAESPVVMLLVAFISLLWPTILMGLSLPLLSKALVRTMRDAPGRISFLYGINTLGSGLGTLVAGWYLIGAVGYGAAVALGGGLSGLVALTALLVARGFDAHDRSETAASAREPASRQVPREVWLWCAFVFASGFIAISLELVWFRVLNVLLESNAYTFAHLLAFILTGYAIGSVLGARVVERIDAPRRLFLWIQGLVVVYVLLSILALYFGFDVFAPSLAETKGPTNAPAAILRARFGYILGYILLPTFLLLPPNILIGLGFPVVQKAVQTEKNTVGQRVGLVQVVNIAGNTAGSIVTGLLLLDTVGTAGTLRVIAVVGLLFMLVLLREQLQLTRRSAKFASGLLAAVLLVSLAFFPNTSRLWARLHGGSTANSIVAEDSSGLAVLQKQNDKATLFANGSPQAAVPYGILHSFLGSLPALVHPAPKQIMVVGIGSGGTPYSVGVHPATERIVAVELIGSELDVLQVFAQEERGRALKALFADNRYQIVVGDGRRELALSSNKFDIIQADAIQPWRSHSGLLYSKEFFEEVRAQLADGGMMAQWRPTARVQETFYHVFPYGVNVGNFVLLGSDKPIAYDKQALIERFQDARVVEYLAAGGIDANAVRGLVEQYDVTTWTPDRPQGTDINTDLLPRDEYYLNNPRRK